MDNELKIQKLTDYLWEIPRTGKMRVPARIYASEKLMKQLEKDQSLQQAANVAHLPGIVRYSLAMPDIHWGYGFPIGGVAATDPDEDGVISPGGVGYDINCLAGETRVLQEDGYTRTIEEMAATWRSSRVVCQDFLDRSEEATEIVGYLEMVPRHPVYRVVTEAGDEIVATGDHPFWTPRGMVPLSELTKGSAIARYPFEGVPYEEPPHRLLLDEQAILRVLADLGKEAGGTAAEQILKHLKARGLVPVYADGDQVPPLLRVLGYVFGDGSIHFVGGSGKGVVSFYGPAEDLEAIRADVARLGFTPSRIYRRERDHRVSTTYREYEFSREETWFKVVGSAFAVLLASLGAPVGKKAAQDYGLPAWISDAPRWQQRLFLASLFGAELSAPRPVNGHGYNLQSPVLSLNKREGWVESGERFLRELGELLAGLGVEVQAIQERAEQTNSDGSRSRRLRLVISSRPENLVTLWIRIGYEYNRRRRDLAHLASQYLKLKGEHIACREEAAREVVVLRAAGVPAGQVLDDLTSPQVNRRFLERSVYGGRKGSPRPAESFPTFTEFVQEAGAGLEGTGMVWDRIFEMEPVPEVETVYDFTVAHRDHNFVANGFVVSNCGVRLARTDLTEEEIRPKLKTLVDQLFRDVPTGVGASGAIKKLSVEELRRVLREGIHWTIKNGYGDPEDAERAEEGGRLDGADPSQVSDRALQRGRNQVGTLGSGNHFLEVDVVERVFLPDAADALGLFPGQVVIQIHSGSRGFGYQVCDDFLKVMMQAMSKYGIELPDRQLCCTPIRSPEGQAYLAAMKCAANFAWANRQVMMHLAEGAFCKALGVGPKDLNLGLVYDVCHNIAKFEEHRTNGTTKTVCVHRKGATRAFGPGHPQVPEAYRQIGQPVLIPGDMGRHSYVLVGAEKAMEETFGSTCHGAGRVMSRREAKKRVGGRNLFKEFEEKGIFLRAVSHGSAAEETPEAYKDAADVVKVMEDAGVSRRVAEVRPVGVIKG